MVENPSGGRAPRPPRVSFDTDALAAWPAGFRCAAIDTDTGELVVWDEGSGVSLLHALASSCAVPVLFPTVTIKGHRYMDGGILSHLNATAAPPTDVLVVLSCHPLGSQRAGGGGSLAASVTPDAELAPLRQTRRLVAVEPDFSDIEAPANMMDPNLAIEAFQIGKRQAADAASNPGRLGFLRRHWASVDWA